ncbi:hypothetical protein M407DRAFT_21756 [Tulasnella calospora MUT 4182]|uniref:PCI domain-containing protein n=1 Tax=Tulasnella calospora MUT 4182 TaxID=1051891 RepID=A0A0C3QMP9_9AGAM|nr:hypothetical protein M407DRAFT_21756 [Tulasnella calospora MUT 4182]
MASQTTPPKQKKWAATFSYFFVGKLREGIVASSRVDDFALEVYETSACWSGLLNDDAQSTSVLSQIPGLYRKLQESSDNKAATSESLTRSQTVAILQALHLLRLHHPSQMEFRAHLNSSDMVPAVYRLHVFNVAAALRRNTYTRLASLTDPSSHPLLRDLPKDAIHIKALLASFGRIRDLARPQAWRCIHAAYREVSAKEEVGRWLSRSLLLKRGPKQLSEWMELKSKSGEAAKKPGDGGGGWTFIRQIKGKS